VSSPLCWFAPSVPFSSFSPSVSLGLPIDIPNVLVPSLSTLSVSLSLSVSLPVFCSLFLFFLFSSLLSGFYFIFLSPFSRLASLSVTALLSSKIFLPLVSFFLFLLLFFCAFLCIYRQLGRGSPYPVQAQGMVVGAWVFCFSSWWGAWVSCLCICRGEEVTQCRSKRCAVCLFFFFFEEKENEFGSDLKIGYDTSNHPHEGNIGV